MGRKGAGVEVREKSIRLAFVYERTPVRKTLCTDGKPMLPTPANIKFAHRLASEIKDKLRHGTFVMAEYFPASGAGGTLTVGAQLDTWLAAQRIELSTKAGYKSAVKFWRETLGDKPLRALKRTDILTVTADRADLSGKTINNYVSVLREALALAVADKLLTGSPAVDLPRASWQQEAPDPFSREEIEAIITDLAKHYPEPIGNLVEWWAFTGVRTSEMAGLRWGSVDLASDYMQISQAIVRGADKDKTKTAVARNVILNSRARAALGRQAKHTRMGGEHVWLDPRYGTPWREERAFRRSYWTPCLKRLGIRYRRPYCMRHTYATLMLMAGMTPAFCAKQLGHSVEIFLRTYSKWMDGGQNALEMGRLEDALSTQILTRNKGGADSS